MVVDRLESAGEVTSVDSVEKRPSSQLTARQEQILGLMREGKVNKEIARELNISLGTVKQHLVAIFKKLNVSNRTMAVSQSQRAEAKNNISDSDGIIAKRPCVILSLKLDIENFSQYRAFYDYLSGIAFDHQAHFINRNYGEGELIFGLKHSSENDLINALLQAYFIYNYLNLKNKSQFSIKGALVVGYMTVTQSRHGGWHGDAIARSLLTKAQELLSLCQEETLLFDPQAITMMGAYDIGRKGSPLSFVTFASIPTLNQWDPGFDIRLIGRDEELALLLKIFIPDSPPVFLIEGDGGMGKSRLCRDVARESKKKNYHLSFYRVMSAGIWDLVNHCLVDGLEHCFSGLDIPESTRQLIIIDDIHLLSRKEKPILLRCIKNNNEHSRKILLSNRGSVGLDGLNDTGFYRLHLSRLTELNSKELAATYNNEKDKSEIAVLSRGVPLFIAELARNQEENIPISLVVTVAARLDQLKVDWKLLYTLASVGGSVNMDELCQAMHEQEKHIIKSVEKASSVGVLLVDKGVVAYKNSLVCAVVAYLFSGKKTL